MYFCKIENFAYGEIIERGFSNTHPGSNKPHQVHNKIVAYSNHLCVQKDDNGMALSRYEQTVILHRWEWMHCRCFT